jgi:hypothetical protein
MSTVPWTFEPFELESEQTWTVYDANLARIVATFYDEGEARMYLKWRNKKQAKRKARCEAEKPWIVGTVRATVFDEDGRC